MYSYTSLQPSPEIQNLLMVCPRSGSQLPGGQRVPWSQIFCWAVRGALTHNIGRCFTETQTLPNLTHRNGWKVGASWSEHAGGPWMASQQPPGLSRGPTPAPAAFGAPANALVWATGVPELGIVVSSYPTVRCRLSLPCRWQKGLQFFLS